MLTAFPCPVCSSTDWRTARRFHYIRDALPKTLKPSEEEYFALRYKVLFEIWFPGQDEVTLTAQYCRQCGFMCYSPRPQEEELTAKYEFLARYEQIGAGTAPHAQEAELDNRRAQRLFELLRKAQPHARTVLDVGGGDGRLLAPFRDAGLDACLLDYNPRPIPGVRRLGATWDDLPASASFDLITCNHVLEHVADPVGFARRLLASLSPDGVAYIEVPLEIWRTIPIAHDPVTHVNFFTRSSLCNTLEAAGGRIAGSRSIGGTYRQWRIPVAWALVRRANAGRRAAPLRSGRRTQRLVDPGWPQRLWRRYILKPQLDGRLDRLVLMPVQARRRIARLLDQGRDRVE